MVFLVLVVGNDSTGGYIFGLSDDGTCVEYGVYSQFIFVYMVEVFLYSNIGDENTPHFGILY